MRVLWPPEAYLLFFPQVGTWDGDDREPRHVIINTEWGAFGDQGPML